MKYAPSHRGLSDAFLDALDQLADDQERGRWWRDVLAHPDLILAVRRESFNVYYRGASVFRVDFRHGRPVPLTHVKYLVRQHQALALLGEAGKFNVNTQALFWDTYAGPQTLNEMMQAAADLTGVEKAGLHPLIQASPNVIDVEIALAGGDDDISDLLESEAAAPVETPKSVGAWKGASPRQDRIDVASLESRGDPKHVWLVFHEAKHFTNLELRAAPKKRPAVLNQLGRYRGSLGQNASGLASSYPLVCQALLRFDTLRRKVRSSHPAWATRQHPELDPLIRDVAEAKRHLTIERLPRLVIFGFDADQRDGALSDIRRRLEAEPGVSVYAVGRTQGLKTTPAFQPSKAVLAEQAQLMAAAAASQHVVRLPPPDRIGLPSGAPSGLSLFFGTVTTTAAPVYLCNAEPTPLSEVMVTSGSATGDPLSPLGTAPLRQPDAVLPGSAGVLIGGYDPMWDGDMLTIYQVTFKDIDGLRYRAQALIGKGGDPKPWIALKRVLINGDATNTNGEAVQANPVN